MDIEALKAAVSGQTAAATPTSSVPELSSLYASTFALPQQELASSGNLYNTGVRVANDKANEEAALRAEAQRLKDIQDAAKYRQIPKEDGGYSFIDPSGQEISAFEYSRATGESPNKILAQSRNPIDVGFVEDYKNLQDYLNAKVNANNDEDSANIASQIEDTVLKNQGVDLRKMQIKDVIKRFQQSYPTVFGLKNRGVAAGSTFIAKPKKASEFDELEE